MSWGAELWASRLVFLFLPVVYLSYEKLKV